MATPNITFTPTLRDKLREAYAIAVADQRETFAFEGHVIVTSYAKYLLEYLDMRFPPSQHEGRTRR